MYNFLFVFNFDIWFLLLFTRYWRRHVQVNWHWK